MKKTILILLLIVACQTAHAGIIARPWLNPNNPNALKIQPGRDIWQSPIKTLPGSITQPASSMTTVPKIQLQTRAQIGDRVTRATDAANNEFKKLGDRARNQS